MSKKVGAKGKYEEWITEEGLLKIEGWARDGLTDEEIAHNIGIARQTLYTWKDKYSDLADALKNGKEIIDRKVENALIKRALGYDYEEVKTIIEKDAKGNDKKRVERTVKHMAPDTTAIAIWLNNRKPEVYRRNHNKEKLDEKRFEEEVKIAEKKYW